jgi:flagellar operon protein
MIGPIEAVRSGGPVPPSAGREVRNGGTGGFGAALDAALNAGNPVRFSAHAQQRLESRRVALTGDDHRRLDAAVDQLAAKGSRESLVLLDRLALVVSVPNRTVITVVPQAEASQSVFTNIDSAVVVPRDGTGPLG